MAAPIVLRQGSRGPAVVTLQNALNTAFMQSRVNPDGDFGARTHSTVVDFQRQNGLAADGVVGPATWTKLLPALAQLGLAVPTQVDNAVESGAMPPSASAAPMGTGMKAAFGVGVGLLLYWLFG